MSNRFFTPEPLAPGEFTLTGPEAHHLATVRRYVPGDRVALFNGDGNEYPAEIVVVERKQAVLNVLGVEAVSRESPFVLTIAAAMPKGDRGDFMIEKLVELGVSRFVPLLTERTIVQPKESRLEKLHHAVIEASKQCGRNVLMTIGELTKWGEFVKHEQEGVRGILQPRAGSVSDALSNHPSLTLPARICAVGPEGGFTESELQLAESAGWIRVSLGPRILRVETAAIAVACAFQ